MKLLNSMKIMISLTIILSIILFPSLTMAEYQEKTFAKLEKIISNKKELILNQLEAEKLKVTNAPNDAILLDTFKTLVNKTNASISMKHIKQLDTHYVTEYSEFYDILFIADNGHIFHSIKMENDFGKNIFKGDIAKSLLSKSLLNNGNTMFIDYDFYIPSKEPAAFFVSRVVDGDNNLGWIVFQFAINAINSILTDHNELGQTGEIYLTNNGKIMITQSRLVPQNTSLQLLIDTQAPKLALKNNHGRKLLADYRGVMVFSVFEKFEFSGVVWIIIAEIDEDEVITNYYKNNKNEILLTLLKQLNPGSILLKPPKNLDNSAIRVDINEYAKAGKNEQIATYGVATCTAVVISKHERFTYLGHIYPLDDLYHSDWSQSFLNFGLWIIGESSSNTQRDLLGSMIKRIKTYEIYPYELQELRVILIAVQTGSLERIVDKLLDAGLFLSQITIILDPTKSFVNILADTEEKSPYFEWNTIDSSNKRWTSPGRNKNLSQLVKQLLSDKNTKP